MERAEANSLDSENRTGSVDGWGLSPFDMLELGDAYAVLTPDVFSPLCACSGDPLTEPGGEAVMCPSIPRFEK